MSRRCLQQHFMPKNKEQLEALKGICEQIDKKNAEAKMKTREQVNELKEQWLSDGCWDIEQTDGFDEYFDELKQFRLDTEDKYKKQEIDRLYAKSRELQVSIDMIKYIEGLEYKIKRLSERIEKLENLDELVESTREYYLRKARGEK